MKSRPTVTFSDTEFEALLKLVRKQARVVGDDKKARKLKDVVEKLTEKFDDLSLQPSLTATVDMVLTRNEARILQEMISSVMHALTIDVIPGYQERGDERSLAYSNVAEARLEMLQGALQKVEGVL